MLHGPRVRPFAGLTLAGLAVFAAIRVFGLWHDETRAVRRAVGAAAEAVSARPGEADVERLARLAALSRMLAMDVLVEAEEGGPAVRGREAVAALAAQLSSMGARQVTLSDIEVAFDDLKTRATVTAVAHVTSASPGGARSYDGQVIRLEVTKDGAGGPWVISRARPEPSLDR